MQYVWDDPRLGFCSQVSHALEKQYQSSEKRLTLIGLHGTGGYGKTTLLNQALHQCQQATWFPYFWLLKINARGRAVVPGSFFDVLLEKIVSSDAIPLALPRRKLFKRFFKLYDKNQKFLAKAEKQLSRHFKKAERNLGSSAMAILRSGKFQEGIQESAIKAYCSEIQRANFREDLTSQSLFRAWKELEELSGKRRKPLFYPVRIDRWIAPPQRRSQLYRKVSEALVADLAGVLEKVFQGRNNRSQMGRGDQRLRFFLILDDYSEVFASVLEDFLVEAFLPDLVAQASFQSVVWLIGRDRILHKPKWAELANLREVQSLEHGIRELDENKVKQWLERIICKELGVPPDDARVRKHTEHIYQEIQGIPLLMAREYVRSVLDADGLTDRMAIDFCHRVAEWMSDEQERLFEKLCFLELVNVPNIEKLLRMERAEGRRPETSGDLDEYFRERANDVYDWFLDEPSIRDDARQGGMKVKEPIRVLFKIKFVARYGPDEYEAKHRRYNESLGGGVL